MNEETCQTCNLWIKQVVENKGDCLLDELLVMVRDANYPACKHWERRT